MRGMIIDILNINILNIVYFKIPPRVRASRNTTTVIAHRCGTRRCACRGARSRARIDAPAAPAAARLGFYFISHPGHWVGGTSLIPIVPPPPLHTHTSIGAAPAAPDPRPH
jgi:hypothetical protein